MIIVEPCGYKPGTKKYAHLVAAALKSKSRLREQIIVESEPRNKLDFAFEFVRLYFRCRSRSNEFNDNVFFLSAEPTLFPVLYFLFPIKGKCLVKIGGYEFRNPNQSIAKFLIVSLRSLLWKLVPDVVKVTETHEVGARLAYLGLKNVKEMFHPVDSSDLSGYEAIPKKKQIVLYFGHRPAGDKNTDLILHLAREKRDTEFWILGYEEDHTIDELIRSSIIKNQLVNVTYKNEKISENEKKRVFRLSDVVVIPYRRGYDGGSGVLLDALVYGKRIVASDVGEFPELLEGSGFGRVYKADCLSSLVSEFKSLVETPCSIDNFHKNRQVVIEKRSFESFTAGLCR